MNTKTHSFDHVDKLVQFMEDIRGLNGLYGAVIFVDWTSNSVTYDRDSCIEGHDWDHYESHHYEDRETQDLICHRCGLVWPEASVYYFDREVMTIE